MPDLKIAFQNNVVRTRDPGLRGTPTRLMDYINGPQAGTLMREQALSIVRDAIVDGRLEPGTRLVERELCEALEISRTVVREVIRDLQGERLIEVAPHRGPSVARLTPRMVREVYAIRAELEAMFLRDFMRVATKAQMEELRLIFEDLLAVGQSHDKIRLIGSSTHYLGHMVKVAGNQVGAEIYDQLLSRINLLRNLAMDQPGQIEASTDYIRKFMKQIEAGNASAAEAVLRGYTQRAADSAIQQLSQRPQR